MLKTRWYRHQQQFLYVLACLDAALPPEGFRISFHISDFAWGSDFSGFYIAPSWRGADSPGVLCNTLFHRARRRP